MKRSTTRGESVLVRVLGGALLVSVIPWIVVTLYLVFQATDDIKLSMDSNGLPIISQFFTFVVFYFLPWVLSVAAIAGTALGISALYWYVKICRRIQRIVPKTV